MSVFDKALRKGKAKAEELLGRATEVYGESHGDPAAEVGGEARRLEAEAQEERAAEERTAEERAVDEQAAEDRRGRHPDDDGLAGAR